MKAEYESKIKKLESRMESWRDFLHRYQEDLIAYANPIPGIPDERRALHIANAELMIPHYESEIKQIQFEIETLARFIASLGETAA